MLSARKRPPSNAELHDIPLRGTGLLFYLLLRIVGAAALTRPRNASVDIMRYRLLPSNAGLHPSFPSPSRREARVRANL